MTDLARAQTQTSVYGEDSALGRWTVARWLPAPGSPLSGLVERIWYFEGTLLHSRERVFPDGRAELIVMLDEPHRDGDTAGLEPFPRVCLNGLRTRPSVVVSPPASCRVVGVVFEALGAAALLRTPMSELVDVTIDVSDALGPIATELGERCADAAGTSPWNPVHNAVAVVEAAAAWMSRRLGDDVPNPAVRWATNRIRQARGALSVDAIASSLDLSRPRLASIFREHVGVTPKKFARIVRFETALGLLRSSENAAQTAADLNYFDQAHLYRDFTEFAGMTPGAFLTANRYPNSNSLAE
jgi:AraC-like DNA-binding protein